MGQGARGGKGPQPMAIANTVEWLQATINAERIEAIDRRVAELESIVSGELRQLREELSLLCCAIENQGA